jgi:spore coat polysaccharide biosynthesis protein SpsF
MSASPNIVAVVQARMTSTRLPGKVMMPLCGKPLLTRMVERVKRSVLCTQVVVATTDSASDDVIQELCLSENMACFRGHPEDLLDRHYKAALACKADLVLKIPSDCPLIDTGIIDKVITFYLDHKDAYDYVGNLHPASYPDGNDVELMTFDALERAWKQAARTLEREHTTPYIWENPKLFRIGEVLWENGKDFSKSHRWTIDYPEDYAFIKKVYDELFDANPNFGLQEIINLLEKRPDIFKINGKYAGEYWYKNHIDELKTVTYKHPENN